VGLACTLLGKGQEGGRVAEDRWEYSRRGGLKQSCSSILHS